MSDNSESASSWSSWGKPITAAIVTSIVAYFQITIFTLTASYAMNRSIYRSGAIRIMTGIFAGLTALITFWVVLFLPKVHYFGLFPVLGSPSADSDKRWGVLNYFRSSYDAVNPEHAGIVQGLVRAGLGWRKERRGDKEVWINTSGPGAIDYPVGGAPPTLGVVDEERDMKAREAGAIAEPVAWRAAIGAVVTSPPPPA
jgi:hypothetical protein